MPVISEQTLETLQTAKAAWEASTAQLRVVLEAIDNHLIALSTPPRTATPPAREPPDPVAPAHPTRTPPSAAADTAPPPAVDDNGAMPKAQRAVLSVLAQHGRRSTTQVAVLTGPSGLGSGSLIHLRALYKSQIKPHKLRNLVRCEPSRIRTPPTQALSRRPSLVEMTSWIHSICFWPASSGAVLSNP